MLTMMQKRILAVLGGIGCTAVAAYAAYWHVGAAAVEELILARIAEERGRGLLIEHAILERSGFPARVQLRIGDIAITDPTAGWSLMVPELLVAVAPWRPLRQEVTVRGPVQARVSGEGQAIALRLTAQHLGGHVDLAPDGRLERASLSGEALGIHAGGSTLLPQSAAAEGLQVDLIETVPVPDTGAGLIDPVGEAVLSLSGITVEGATMPLGPRIERIGMRAVLRGALPSGLDTAGKLEGWRDSGGVVDMPWLALDWGSLGLTGNGALALDAELRPLGSVALRVAGFRETLGELAEAGIIDSRSAGAVGLAMSLFARSPPGGGAPVVETVLRMQDGEIALGPFRLGRLRPVLGLEESGRTHGDVAPAAASEPRGEAVPPPPHVERLTRPLAVPPQLAPDWVSRPDRSTQAQPIAPAPGD